VRFTVAHVVRLVAAGWTIEQIREEFPFIEGEDVRQALDYAGYSSDRVLPRGAVGDC
jgi:uncharacterized protein (DUF433 family)